MKHLTITIILLSINIVKAQNWDWVKQAGSSYNLNSGTSTIDAYDHGNGISSDGDGNIYVTGSFVDTAIFGSITLIGNSSDPGYTDIFVAKYDSLGNVIWAKKAGGQYSDFGFSIVTNNVGESYVSGSFAGNATFGINTLIGGGDWDLFLAKYDSNGNVIWVTKAVCNAIWNDPSSSFITIDSMGNSYVTGSFRNEQAFDSITLTAPSGSYDIFIAKYDANGNVVWAKNAGGIARDEGNGISVDNLGNCYVTGIFYNPATFDTITLTSYGSYDIFIAKYDSNGNILWAKNAGGTGSDYGNAISIDSLGNSYVTGSIGNTATFGNITLTEIGNDDFFVAKFDINGNILWAKSTGDLYSSYLGNGIEIDELGSVYVTGGRGNDSIFVAKYDTTGNELWITRAAGKNNWAKGRAITMDNFGNCYVTGSFGGSNIPPNTGNVIFGSNVLKTWGSWDIFIGKIGSIVSPIAGFIADSSTICQGESVSFFDASSGPPTVWNWTFPGGTPSTSTAQNPIITYNTLGTYDVILIDSNGLGIDTIIMSNYISVYSFPSNTITTGGPTTFCQGDSVILTASSANSYLWNTGDTVQSIYAVTSGIYKVTATNSGGCSTISTIISVNVNPTVNPTKNLSICMADSTFLQGSYQTSPGTYFDTLVSVNGCDSIIVTSLNLQPNPPSAYFTVFPDTIPLHWFVLNSATGNTPIWYSWSWGDGGSSVGATPSHTYSSPGYYNICLTIVDSYGCSNTYCDSSTYINKDENAVITINVILQTTNIDEQVQSDNPIYIYPNPTDGKIILRLINNESKTVMYTVTIYNLMGEQIGYSSIHSFANSSFDISAHPSGIYFIKIKSKGQTYHQKLIKQ